MYNIIVFSHFYKPHIGGVEKYVENFYKRLTKKKILIITSKYEDLLTRNSQDHNVEILRIDSVKIIEDKYFIPSFKGLKQISKIFRNHTNERTEIHTHTRFYFNNFIASILAKKHKLNHYHFEHGSSFVKDGSLPVRIFSVIFDKTLGKYILKNASLVFPISDGVKTFLTENYKNISYGPILYNSYDFKENKFIKKPKPSTLKILFVGRLVKSKGIFELVDTAKILVRRKLPFHLTIVGGGSEMERIKKYIKENNLGKYIELKGRLEYEKTQSLYPRYSLFINPSYSEGLPTTVLEALANSLVIVATDVGGTREIIPPKHLIPKKDITPSVISSNIINIYNNWDKYQDIFYSIYSKSYQKFNWDNNVQTYIKAIHG
ncbi:MAG: glycosyltransferase family 4 protein [Candidatus Dojkabacteria bacterium]